MNVGGRQVLGLLKLRDSLRSKNNKKKIVRIIGKPFRDDENFYINYRIFLSFGKSCLTVKRFDGYSGLFDFIYS